jgi:hypothetical protein
MGTTTLRVHNGGVAGIERKNVLHVLLSKDEDAALRALAEAQGLSVSDYIRQFIRRESEARAAIPVAPPSSPRTRAAKKR